MNVTFFFETAKQHLIYQKSFLFKLKSFFLLDIHETVHNQRLN